MQPAEQQTGTCRCPQPSRVGKQRPSTIVSLEEHGSFHKELSHSRGKVGKSDWLALDIIDTQFVRHDRHPFSTTSYSNLEREVFLREVPQGDILISGCRLVPQDLLGTHQQLTRIKVKVIRINEFIVFLKADSLSKTIGL